MSFRNLHHVVLVECVAVAGLCIMVTGYRYVRFAMFVAAFWLSFCVFYVFSPLFIRTQYCCDKEKFYSVHIGASVAFGILCGLFICSLYRFGIVLIGKCFGILIAAFVVHSAMNIHASSKLLLTVVVGLMACVFAALAWRFEKIILIAATSCIGSFMMLCGIDIFVQSNFALVIFSLFLYLRDAFVTSVLNKDKLLKVHLPGLHKVKERSNTGPILVGAWIFLTFFSSLLQYYVTSKNIEKGGKILPFDCRHFCSCCCEEVPTKVENKSKYLR